ALVLILQFASEQTQLRPLPVKSITYSVAAAEQTTACDFPEDQNAVGKAFDSTDRSKRIQNRLDRISDLPDSILHYILSFLDSKSSVQTCILSRRWRCVWKYVDVLNFIRISLEDDEQSEGQMERFLSNDDHQYERHVDQVLSLRSDCSSVRKVRIDCEFHLYRMNLRDRVFDKIVKYAASHGVQELFICSRQSKTVDEVGLVCPCYQSLKVLELSQASIEKTAFGLWSCLQLLGSLTLTDCWLKFGDASVDAFANFPILESLKLVHCYDPGQEIQTSVLKVTGSKLINLEIVSPGFNSYEIDAPRLQTFGLKSRYPYGTLPDLSKSNLPFLNRANIELLGDKQMFVYIFPNCSDIIKQGLLEPYTNLLKVLHNAQSLILQVEPLEWLIKACNSVKCQPSPFKRIKSLHLKCFKESLDVPDQVIRYFLGESPNEEDKHFTVKTICYDAANYYSYASF
ncbi:Putative F-box/FBD/LRR-repeat protein At4g03220, partial [Linum perenne]